VVLGIRMRSRVGLIGHGGTGVQLPEQLTREAGGRDERRPEEHPASPENGQH
jgi:hypothetical protein